MSGRFVVLVIVLTFVSAAVGAGAAFLLQSSDDAAETITQVAVVATSAMPDDSVQEQSDAGAQASEQSQKPSTQSDAAPTTDRQQAAEPAAQSEAAPPAQSEQQADSEHALQSQPSEPQQAQQEVEVQDEYSAEAEPRMVASLRPDLLSQGEALALTVESEDAFAVAATIGSRSWNLIETSPGHWWTVIPIPRDADTGTTLVAIDLYEEGGVWLSSVTESFIVLANAAPFEEVILGGTGTPADPAAIQRDIAVRFTEHIAVSGPPRWNGPWLSPVEGEVTGVFGSRRSYDGVEAEGWHHGHDIAAQHGDPIIAPATGTVVWTGELVLHGIGVIIDHGAGVYSGYWHMSMIAVREGMEVAPGDWLGNIGTTGLSTGPHLHWEVIIQGIDVDPIQWLGDDRPPLPSSAEVTDQSTDTLD